MGTLFDIRRITTTNSMMKFILFLAFFVGLAAARSFSYENDYINRGSIRQTSLNINRRPRMVAPCRTPCTIPPTIYRRPVRRTNRRRPVRTYRRTNPCNYQVRTMSPCQTNNLISNMKQIQMKQMTPCQYPFVSSCTTTTTAPCLESTTVSTPEVFVDPVPEPKPELVIRTLANIVEVAQPDN